MQNRTSANDRRLAFIRDCVEQQIDWKINCSIVEHDPGRYAVVSATVQRGPDIITVHKMKYAESQNDDGYISWAETMAISKAISFLMEDEGDTVHSAEEFEELVRRKLMDMDQIITENGDLSAWFNAIGDSDLKDAIRPTYERIQSRSIVSEAAKQTKGNGSGSNLFD